MRKTCCNRVISVLNAEKHFNGTEVPRGESKSKHDVCIKGAVSFEKINLKDELS